MVEGTLIGGCDEVPIVYEDAGLVSSGGDSGGSGDEGVFGDESSWMYCFGASTTTLDRIREMVEKGYFSDGEAWAPREKTTSELNDDEAVVFEDFFFTSLQMPPHSTLIDILLKFQA
jgi:hypothetical protein